MATAARLILPAASVRGGGEGGRSLNFEDELRRAVSAACTAPLDEDMLEVVACTACEVIDGLKDGDSAESSLQSALDPILTEGGYSEEQRSAVVKALSDRAGSIAAGNMPATQPTVPAAVARAIPSCNNRWVSRAQVEQERAEEYLEERAEWLAREQEDREAREAAVIELHESKFRSRHRESVAAAGAAPAPAEASAAPESESDSEDEVAKSHRQALQRRLRELGEPITLFGETSAAREARLRHREMCHDQDILAKGSTNVMQILDRRLAQGVLAERDEEETARKLKAPLGIADKESDRAVRDADGLDDDDDDMEEEADIKVVTTWLRATLREWESDLTARSKVEQLQADFKAEKNQFRQSKQYLKPLRRSLKEGGIEREIVRSIADIAGACDRREYKLAKEAYMRLSIGNQAWPMGVTLVTFHDRPNRHMIGEEAAAHALDDETTRKYVQMVKRLITFCEGKWPIDPSLAA